MKKNIQLIYKIYLMIVISGLNIYMADVSTAIGQTDMIEKEMIIKLAQEEVMKLGYNINFMDVKMSFHEEPWNDCLPKECITDYCKKRKDKLDNKQYWAVYFSPQDVNVVHKGGDICVYIDANTGMILTAYRGK